MNLWTTKLVRHFIYTRFGVEYCRERVRQLLHTLGFRLRRLRHGHLKAKAEEQEVFIAELDLPIDAPGRVVPQYGHDRQVMADRGVELHGVEAEGAVAGEHDHP